MRYHPRSHRPIRPVGGGGGGGAVRFWSIALIQRVRRARSIPIVIYALARSQTARELIVWPRPFSGKFKQGGAPCFCNAAGNAAVSCAHACTCVLCTHMYLCPVHTHVPVSYAHTCTCVLCANMYLCPTHVRTCMYASNLRYMYVCMHRLIHTHMHTCTYIHVHAHILTYTVHILTHIHAHIHIHAHSCVQFRCMY